MISAIKASCCQRLSLQRHLSGFSLIELVIFIVIISVLATGLLSGINQSLSGSAAIRPFGQSMRLAEERMALILPQRKKLGFSNFVKPAFDPCTSSPASTQAICTSFPAGYTVTADLLDNWSSDTDYKIVIVTVSGPANTRLQSLLANY